MTLRTVLTPLASDVLDLYTEAAPMKPVEAKAAIVMLARSEVVGWSVGGQLVAAALFYPLPPIIAGERYIELAFVCRPWLKHHLLAFIRGAELTRDRLSSNTPVRIRAFVRSGHRPGARLAALCGMSRIGAIGGFDQWEFEGKPDERICPGREIAIQRS